MAEWEPFIFSFSFKFDVHYYDEPLKKSKESRPNLIGSERVHNCMWISFLDKEIIFVC